MMANDLKQKNKDLNEQRNKYLFREKCFLCHKDNPNPQDMSSDEQNESSSRDDDDVKHTEIIRLFGLNPNKKLKKFPLWMCSDCKKNCKNEEKKSRLLKMLGKNMPHNNLDFFNIEIKRQLDDEDVDNAKAKMPSEVLFTDQTCSCKGCKDRRLIEEQEELHHTLVNNNWKELRHWIRCVYRQSGTSLTNSNSNEELEKYRGYARRLILYEAHKLYIQIQDEVKDYLNEANQRLLKQLRKSLKTQTDAYSFILVLLDEYDSLCQAARLISTILYDLEQEHLKRFHITWELDNKNLFRTIIYENELIQISIPNLFDLLINKEATNGKDKPKSPQTTSKIYSRFINFIEEMNVINAVWCESKQLLDKYEIEQKTIFKLKEEMLKKDYEFYKICRKLIKDKLKSNQKLNEFLHAKKTNTKTVHNNNSSQHASQKSDANSMNCTCDECTIRNLIICGILDADFKTNDSSADKVMSTAVASKNQKHSIRVKLSENKNENKKSIESAAAVVALAAATALNFDANHGTKGSDCVDCGHGFDVCGDCYDDDEDDDDDDEEDSGDIGDDLDSDLNDLDSEIDDDPNSDNEHNLVHRLCLNKKISIDTLNKFKLCKNLYNLHLKFEKDKMSKSIDIITRMAKSDDSNEPQKCSKTDAEPSCTKKTKQKAKTTTTGIDRDQQLYHIYEAEITEEKKYILSENELIEAIKEYRLSQHGNNGNSMQPCTHNVTGHGHDDDDDDFEGSLVDTDDDDDDDNDDGEDNDDDDDGDVDDEYDDDDPQRHQHKHRHHVHHGFHQNGCMTCCHCCSPSASANTITTTTQTISGSFHHTVQMHQPPPTLSKNFIEIRERLRKKCIKKNETSNLTATQAVDTKRNRSPSSSSSTTTPTNPVSTLDIDTLVKYINGETINEKTSTSSTGQTGNNASKKQKKKQNQKSEKEKDKNKHVEKETDKTVQQQQATKNGNKKMTASQEQTKLAGPLMPKKQPTQQTNNDEDPNKKSKKSKKKNKKQSKENLLETNGTACDTSKLKNNGPIDCSTKTKSSNKENGSNDEPSENMEVNDGLTMKTIENIFMPRNDIENLNETEKEIEEFKRFCFECKPINERKKVKVNLDHMPPKLVKKV